MDVARRRVLLALAGVIPAACASSPGETAPAQVPLLRAPALGQQWTYTVRNLYSGRAIDEIVEKVVAVGSTVTLERSSATSGALAPEIHSVWGQLAQDPHWGGRAMRFAKPLPAWPSTLATDRQWTIQDRYGFGSRDDDYSWSQLMRTQRWQRVLVAGRSFDALVFTNLVHYTNPESVFRLSSERSETVWFVPEIGRWSQRKFRGSFDIDGRGSHFNEDSTGLELTAWS